MTICCAVGPLRHTGDTRRRQTSVGGGDTVHGAWRPQRGFGQQCQCAEEHGVQSLRQSSRSGEPRRRCSGGNWQTLLRTSGPQQAESGARRQRKAARLNGEATKGTSHEPALPGTRGRSRSRGAKHGEQGDEGVRTPYRSLDSALGRALRDTSGTTHPILPRRHPETRMAMNTSTNLLSGVLS